MRFSLVLLLPALALGLAACNPGNDADAGRDGARAESSEVVVYTGRREVLVGPIVDRFREASGFAAQTRFGRDAEMLAALQEEGARSRAGVLWVNTPGALAAAGDAGLLQRLPDSLLQKPAAFVPSNGLWVPVTIRFRVLAYSPQRVDTSALPASVMDLPQHEDLRGRIGWTPTYSSFQDFLTAMRVIHGDDATRAWVREMKALQPKAYESNAPMLEAMAAGEIDVALTNHYYVLRMMNDAQGEAPVAMAHFAPGDVGNLALVTGAGLLATAADSAAALRFIDYLLSPEAQAEAAERVNEYPIVSGAPVPQGGTPFDEALRLSPEIDFSRLNELEATLQLLREEEVL